MDEEKKQKENITPLIHTFQSDANKYIKEKNISLADIALKEKVKYKTDGEIKKNKTAYFAVPLILIALILASTVAYNKLLKNRVTAEKKETYSRPFIFSDETRIFEIPVSPVSKKETENLAKSIKDGLSKKYKKNGFIYAVFTKDKKQIETDEFFNFLKISDNPELLKSLEKKFNINIYTDSEGKNNLILVFKTKVFKTTYRAMFDLEKTLLTNLSAIVPEHAKKTPPISYEATSTIKATSTSKETSSTETFLNFNSDKSQVFTDETINNIDVRVLEKDKEIVLIYGFFSEKYLIIASSKESFKKSLERLKISLN